MSASEPDGARPGQEVESSAPSGRQAVKGWNRLTLAEQLCGAVVFLVAFAITEAAQPSLQPWIVGPVLAAAYTVVGGCYSRNTRPWRGPRVLRRAPGARGASNLVSRVKAWWKAPGRRGLLAVVAGLFCVLAGLGGAASDTALLSDLRSHGVEGDATVTSVEHSPGRYTHGELDAVAVRFKASRTSDVVEQLQIMDTVPSSIAVGNRVTVIFDPGAPENVLLTSQMTNGHVWADYVVAALGGLAAIAGMGWWLANRRRRRDTGQHEATSA